MGLTAASTLNSQFVHWACHYLGDISIHLLDLKKDYVKKQLQSLCEGNPTFLSEFVSSFSGAAAVVSGTASGPVEVAPIETGKNAQT